MVKDNRGQAAAVDLMLVCICICVFAVTIWAASDGGKAPETHTLRARQDYARSMLLSILYTTPDGADMRYSSKTLSDIICMHLTDREAMPLEVVIAKVKEAKIGEALAEKAVGSEAEWFIYAGLQDETGLCLHGKSGSDAVEECPADSYVYAEESTAATAEVVFAGKGTGRSDGTTSRIFRVPIFLGIKWS